MVMAVGCSHQPVGRQTLTSAAVTSGDTCTREKSVQGCELAWDIPNIEQNVAREDMQHGGSDKSVDSSHSRSCVGIVGIVGQLWARDLDKTLKRFRLGTKIYRQYVFIKLQKCEVIPQTRVLRVAKIWPWPCGDSARQTERKSGCRRHTRGPLVLPHTATDASSRGRCVSFFLCEHVFCACMLGLVDRKASKYQQRGSPAHKATLNTTNSLRSQRPHVRSCEHR